MKALIDYMGGLRLAGGDHDGQPFKVLPWEKRFINGAFRGSWRFSAIFPGASGKWEICTGGRDRHGCS